jgi:hypothetical protein
MSNLIEINLGEERARFTSVGASKDQDLVGGKLLSGRAEFSEACDIEVPIRTENQTFGPVKVTRAWSLRRGGVRITNENVFKISCRRVKTQNITIGSSKYRVV